MEPVTVQLVGGPWNGCQVTFTESSADRLMREELYVVTDDDGIIVALPTPGSPYGVRAVTRYVRHGDTATAA